MKNFQKKTSKQKTEESTQFPMRLNKFVAHCGICSRRKADEFIKEGLVTVNGDVVLEMGHKIKPDDVVTFRGKKIDVEKEQVYILLNKPKNYITTVSDERNRKTVMDIVGKAVKQRIFPVGRLDRATTGLLLFTNDGDLAKKLTHPSHGVKKIYHVILDKPLSQAHFEKIKKGFDLEDGHVKPDKIHFLQENDKTIIGVEIHIGRNRIVRRMFEHWKYQVLKLDRVYFGGLTKKDLPRGKFRFLKPQEIIMLKHFV